LSNAKKINAIYNFKISEFSTILSASLPAVRLGNVNAMTQVFPTTKLITIYLQNCCADEGLFTLPYLVSYKTVRNS